MTSAALERDGHDVPRAPCAVSAAMRDVIAAADDVAATPTTVLLLGESGTGKEVLARYIHSKSPRSRGPWVAVNCAALPAELLESELFGHERGAFTGAAERRAGRIEQADGGTLVLDELSELPLPLQAKLLRVIQEREVDRVGGTRPIPVDVRIIATSNRDLEAMVQQKLFRADLFYRINVFPIQLPALRARPDDILPLAQRLLGEAAARMGRLVPELSSASVDALRAHAFPGNVRELSNLLERALVRCRSGKIEVQELALTAPAHLRVVPTSASTTHLPTGLPLDLHELEHLAIQEALKRVNGNRTHAARLLGIGLRTLRNKLRLLRIADEGEPAISAERPIEPGQSSRGASQFADFMSPAMARASHKENP